MTGPITFSGLGSGLDIESIVKGLVSASSGQLTSANNKVSQANAAVSTLSGIGSLLGELRTVVDSLDSATKLASYSGKVSKESAATISVDGSASPASYTASNVLLAREQRNYSSAQTTKDTALNQSGTLKFSQNGTDYDIAIAATDTLADIGAKINEKDAKLNAAVFFDGTNYRLQVSGSETGADNAFTVQELNGVNLGLTAAPFQTARNASVDIDGFTVTSSSNSVKGAIQGVTLELKEETTTPFTVSVQANPTSMKKSLDDFVAKYNNVIGRIHSVSGFGDSAGSSAALKGDGTLRSITNRLSSMVLTQAGTGAGLETLADLGIRLNRDGTMKVDSAQMETALQKNPDAFKKVLAGDETSDGLMDMMSDLVKSFTEAGTGMLDIRKEGLRSTMKIFESSAAREQKRLDFMEVRLRSQFSTMDAAMGQNNISMSYLARM
jgi:flagellar hook-associated protein 2